MGRGFRRACTRGCEGEELYRSLKYRKTDRSDLSSMNQLVGGLRENLERVDGSPVPVVVHYGVERVIPDKYPRLPRGKNLYSQLDAYKNALKGRQFFITTHSPIVASDTDGRVFGIKNGEIVPQRTFGKLSFSN